MMPIPEQLHLISVEIFLSLAAIVLLLYGVFRGDKVARITCYATALALSAGGYLLIKNQEGGEVLSGLFAQNGFTIFLKILVYASAALVLVMSAPKLEEHGVSRFELPILMLLSVVGMSILISANNLLSLYMGLELMSLALYVLAAFSRDNEKCTEAGLKYFMLGALASGMMLYGISLVYGFTGELGYQDIAAVIGKPASIREVNPGVSLGVVFILVGFLFKVSAAPFHMWTPDVYQGAPTPVTAFFSVAPKIAAVAALLRIVSSPFGSAVFIWQDIIQLVAVLTMIVGAFAALRQTNIKRLLAYSSIGHVGYMLIGVAAFREGGTQGVIIYLALYLLMTVGAFACVLNMKRGGTPVEEISDLAGVGKYQPKLALALAIIMFSMAGIPPLAGFFGKMYVFLAAVKAGLIPLAVIGVLSSVVAAFYYLRVVKIMYLDEALDKLDNATSASTQAVLLASSAIILLFFVYPTPLVNAAIKAAQSIAL